MKKIITILLSTLMALTLFACGNSVGSKISSEENSTKDTGVSVNKDSEDTGNITSTEINIDEAQTNNNQQNKVLVAYFSATNNTAGVAKIIADGIGADIYEITPQTPYTSADLNYNDKKSRSTIEMNNPDSRPEISGSVNNMNQYDIVFIGYPIWWGEAPRIIDTFLESYDFSGKTIVPFCTSNSSGVGSSAANLKKSASQATWIDGHRFGGNDSNAIIMNWVNSLGLNIGKNK